MQNPDNTFPSPGRVMTVLDNRGTIGPSDQLSVSSITVDNMFTVSEFQTPQIVTNDIQTDTIEVASKLTANEADIVYLHVQDLSADCISVDKLNATTITAGDISATSLYLSEGLTSEYVNTNIVNTVAVNTDTVNTNYISAEDISGGNIVADNATVKTLNATDISSVTVITSSIAADNATVTTLHAIDISSVTITSGVITADKADIGDISAGHILADSIVGTSISADTLQVVDISATTATITMLNVTDICAERIYVKDISAENIHTLNLVAANAVIQDLQSQGVFDISNINTTTLNVSNTLTVYSGIFDYIQVNNQYVPDKVSFETLEVANLSVYSNLEITFDGKTTLLDTSINGYLITQDVTVNGTLNVAGQTTLTDVTANGSVTITGNLAVEGDATFVDVSADSITAPVVNVTEYMTLMDPSHGVINTGIQINPGVLTYNISGGLYLNNIPIVSTALNQLYQESFMRVGIVNNLKTVTDISSTLFALTASYNSFLELLNNRNIIIRLLPLINVNSQSYIQFVLEGVVQSPLLVPSGLNVTDLTTYLTNFGGGIIKFESILTGIDWNVKLTITNPGIDSYIADVSGMPTGSLQVLRLLGFDVPISNNVYETYVLVGSSYESSIIPLVAGSVSGSILQPVVNYPNNLAIPSVTPNVTPYSTTFGFNGLLSPLYIAIQINDAYTLYPTSNSIDILELEPDTPYPYTVAYLDDYNNRSVTGTLRTNKIPYPTDISAEDITFNSFILTWAQPYPDKVYEFIVDASGRELSIVNENIGDDVFLSFAELYQNETYYIDLRSLDIEYDSQSAKAYITVKTAPLIVPDISIENIPNSNIQKRVVWEDIPPTDVSAELFYRFDLSAAYTDVLLGPNQTSYDLNTPGTFFRLYAYMQYNDNKANIVKSPTLTYPYSTAFGFKGYTAESFFIVDKGLNTSIGYVFPANSDWLGYTINKIQLSVTNSSTVPTQIRAIVYEVLPSSISGLYIAPSYQTLMFTPGVSVRSSNSVDISGTVIKTVDLTFSTPFVAKEGTMILLSIPQTAGASVLQISTFDQTVPADLASAFMTALLLNSSGTLTNSFATSGFGAICEFSYV